MSTQHRPEDEADTGRPARAEQSRASTASRIRGSRAAWAISAIRFTTTKMTPYTRISAWSMA